MELTRYATLADELSAAPRRWLVTGAAGFIGSNLVAQLLSLGQHVVGLDNFCTGHRHNVDDVIASVGPDAAARLRFVEGDICDGATCRDACRDVDLVLHQAALGSVPRSLENPLASHHANVNGFLEVLLAARDAGVRRVVFASSSSVYGDHPALPKVEDAIGQPLSPYAATKRIDEIYANVIQRAYGLELVGLRYFNVFGPRQDPQGAYAAVIPRWIGRLLAGDICEIYGDGATSRDFCYVANAVQANILAATAGGDGVTDQIYNVGCDAATTLTELYAMIRDRVAAVVPGVAGVEATYRDFRAGDVRHSHASIAKAAGLLGYEPSHDIEAGLAETVDWYIDRHTAG